MAQSITHSLAYFAGRASGVPLEAGAVSRYLRLPQVIVAHYVVAGVLRLRGRRFDTDLSHRLAFEIGRHRSSGPGWFAGGTFDRSLTAYQVGEHMQVDMERSSELYAVQISLGGREVASASHDGEKFTSWTDPAIPSRLHPDIEKIFMRYVNPWLLNTPQDYAAFDERARQVEADAAKALAE